MSTNISTLLVSSPDTCGGRLRIQGTRITVNQVVALYKKGNSAEDIAEHYSNLTMAQVYAALAYYHANREEIEADLAVENQEASNALNSSNKESRLEVLRELQQRLGLTSARAANWQAAVRDGRR